MADYTIAQLQQQPYIIAELEDVDMERLICDFGLEYHETNYQNYSTSLRDSIYIACIDPEDRNTYEAYIEYEYFCEYQGIDYSVVQLPSDYALYVVECSDLEDFTSEKYSKLSEAHAAIESAIYAEVA